MIKNLNGFRDYGAQGALIDEYERALEDFYTSIGNLSSDDLQKNLDPTNPKKIFQTIQGILTHVLNAGYVYIYAIRNHLGEDLTYIEHEHLNNVAEYISAYKKMLDDNAKLFTDNPELTLVEHNSDAKVLCPWGQRYDVDGLMEHAIVHILRHRRQIERYKIKLSQS